jgi:hypothetical protein
MNVCLRGNHIFHNALRGSGFIMLLIAVQQLSSIPDAAAWELDGEEWYGPAVKGEDSGGGGSYSGAGSFAGTQRVFLDFDTFTGVGDYVYSPAERATITAGIAAIYAPWDFTFAHAAVPAAPFATVFFNDGPAGGLAMDIDFRNLDLGNTATVNVCGILGGCPGPPAATIVGLSTTIGAHELGHLVGLRHADSLGPIGFGLSPTGPPAAAYLPVYPGPIAAVETTGHTMASPASVGQTLAEAIAGTYMGERAAVKLEFTEVGLVSPEVGAAHGTPATAQPLTLPTFPVPNTAVPGDLNFGKSLFADAEVVTASIATVGQADYYSFSGTAGDIINAEVISLVPDRFGAGDVDGAITMFMPDGVTPVVHGIGTAFNDDEFESFDSALIDIVLPATGTYYVRVNSSPLAPGDTGAYELYLYRFRTVIPEPASLSLLMLGALVAAGSARRARQSS